MDAENHCLEIFELGMHFDPSAGGADRYFDGLLKGLEAEGADFYAAAFGDDGQAIALDEWISEGGKKSSRISLGAPNAGLLDRRAAILKWGKRALAQSSRRVVATHFALYAFPLVSRLRSACHVVHFHGPWADESAHEGQKRVIVAAKRQIERKVYASAKRLIALSAPFRDILVQKYGIPAERIAIVPGGVDVDRFRPTADKKECRRHLNWPTGGKIILCVRRMVRRMGLESLLEAFGQIAATCPEVVLVLGGRGPLEEALRQQAAALGLTERILFAGFIPENDLPLAYAAADFSIVPSQSLEGFGLITVESLACGTPVLVTPVGGLPEAVRNFDATLVLADSSVNAIVSGLRRGLSELLPSPELCRRYAVENFSWPSVARRVLQVYQEAADDSIR